MVARADRTFQHSTGETLATAASEPASTLTLRATLVLATLFWIYVSVSTVVRWDLLKEAIPRTPAPSWPINALTCVILWPVLLLLATLSHRVGYNMHRWPRVVVANVLLALVFGLCARPALAAAWGIFDSVSFGEALSQIDGPVLATKIRLWGVSILEDVVQYLVLQGIVAGAAFYVHMRHEQEQRQHLRHLYDRARLQALRMQTNPHFLFNTLSAVAGLIRARPEAAEAMVTRLGELLRSTLTDRDVDFVPLHREIELGEQYLAIQAERFEERLRYTIEVDPAVRNAAIPPLLLQPLLENAVEHGLTTQEGSMLIEVQCAARAGHVEITVRNGLCEHVVASPRNGFGFGLENVRTRLQAAFGETAKLAVGQQPGGHFEVCMSFPVRAVDARGAAA